MANKNLNLLNDQERQLLLLLDRARDPRYYSYSLRSIMEELRVDREKLVKLGENLRMQLGADYQVNIFEWRDRSGKEHTFVGFEYRRKDYERDRLSGINVVENDIKRGVYAA